MIMKIENLIVNMLSRKNTYKNIAQNILSIPLESFIKDTDRWVQQLTIFLARELKFDARKNVQLPRLFLEGFNGTAKSAQ